MDSLPVVIKRTDTIEHILREKSPLLFLHTPLIVMQNVDIFLLILQYLTPAQKIQIRRTCKFFYRLGTRSVLTELFSCVDPATKLEVQEIWSLYKNLRNSNVYKFSLDRFDKKQEAEKIAVPQLNLTTRESEELRGYCTNYGKYLHHIRDCYGDGITKLQEEYYVPWVLVICNRYLIQRREGKFIIHRPQALEMFSYRDTLRLVHLVNNAVVTSKVLVDGSLKQCHVHNIDPRKIVFTANRYIISEITPSVPVEILTYRRRGGVSDKQRELVKDRFLHVYNVLDQKSTAIIIDGTYEIEVGGNSNPVTTITIDMWGYEESYFISLRISHDTTEWECSPSLRHYQTYANVHGCTDIANDGYSPSETLRIIDEELEGVSAFLEDHNPFPGECVGYVGELQALKELSPSNIGHLRETAKSEAPSISFSTRCLPSGIPNEKLIAAFRKRFCSAAPRIFSSAGIKLQIFEDILRQERLLKKSQELLDAFPNLTIQGNTVDFDTISQDEEVLHINTAPYLLCSTESQVILLSVHKKGAGEQDQTNLIYAIEDILTSWLFRAYPIDENREIWIIKWKVGKNISHPDEIESKPVPKREPDQDQEWVYHLKLPYKHMYTATKLICDRFKVQP